MATIELRHITKSYGAQTIVQDIDLTIRDQEFLVLVGPSGCGKSTLLRMVAGLESVTRGDISIDGKNLEGVAAKDRDVAMVFQNYALFPHLTVYQNMAFGMRLRHTPDAEIKARIDAAAGAMNITSLLSRRPGQLSGGQKQRVAMGRALVRNARVFLFDEPLSNLDAQLRIQMRMEIKKLHQRIKATFVYVTHDQVEAMTMADRIVVMNQGRIEQIGTPGELYERPATRFVAGFIGSPPMNFIPCTLENRQSDMYLQLTGGPAIPLTRQWQDRFAAFAGQSWLLGVRPEHITEQRAHVNATQYDFTAQPSVMEPMGNDTMVYFNVGGVDICARVSPHVACDTTGHMSFTLDYSHACLVDALSGQIISRPEPQAQYRE